VKVQSRDVRLVREIALSHVMSRDQIMARYFGSVTRTNTRLRELAAIGLVRKLTTPFFSQSLYMAGSTALEVAGLHISPLLAARTGTPRFIQHALTVTNVRIALLNQGAQAWKFEQQLRTTFQFRGRTFDVRPDGLAYLRNVPTFIEVDMGHVSLPKFTEKLRGYEALSTSGTFTKLFNDSSFKLLVLTISEQRASSLMRLALPSRCFEYLCVPFADLGIPHVGAWS
jgi:hypothetical protein